MFGFLGTSFTNGIDVPGGVDFTAPELPEWRGLPRGVDYNHGIDVLSGIDVLGRIVCLAASTCWAVSTSSAA